MRTKQVSLDGATVTIAALTMNQVKEFSAQYQEAKNNGLDVKQIAEANVAIVLGSLNRASAGHSVITEEKKHAMWTREKLEAEWDSIFYSHVFSEVLAFSGVQVTEIMPGEKKAAS